MLPITCFGDLAGEGGFTFIVERDTECSFVFDQPSRDWAQQWLARLTGRDFGQDREAWEAWLRTPENAARALPPPYSSEGQTLETEDERQNRLRALGEDLVREITAQILADPSLLEQPPLPMQAVFHVSSLPLQFPAEQQGLIRQEDLDRLPPPDTSN